VHLNLAAYFYFMKWYLLKVLAAWVYLFFVVIIGLSYLVGYMLRKCIWSIFFIRYII